MSRLNGLARAAVLSAMIAFGLSSAQASQANIVETARQAGSFNTLVTALEAAGLVETLQGEGPFTVFAPTDEAFAKLPEGTLQELLQPENREQLVAILTYHVVPGRVTSDQLAGQQLSVETVQGTEVRIDATGLGVQVDEAMVTTPDIEASNGVIHVIDQVILPD